MIPSTVIITRGIIGWWPYNCSLTIRIYIPDSYIFTGLTVHSKWSDTSIPNRPRWELEEIGSSKDIRWARDIQISINSSISSNSSSSTDIELIRRIRCTYTYIRSTVEYITGRLPITSIVYKCLSCYTRSKTHRGTYDRSIECSRTSIESYDSLSCRTHTSSSIELYYVLEVYRKNPSSISTWRGCCWCTISWRGKGEYTYPHYCKSWQYSGR